MKKNRLGFPLPTINKKKGDAPLLWTASQLATPQQLYGSYVLDLDLGKQLDYAITTWCFLGTQLAARRILWLVGSDCDHGWQHDNVWRDRYLLISQQVIRCRLQFGGDKTTMFDAIPINAFLNT